MPLLLLVLLLALAAWLPAPAPAAERSVYVSSADAEEIAVFDPGPSGGSGALVAVGDPAATGTEPAGIAVSPDGDNVYVANRGSGTVRAYAAGAGGQLTALSGPDATTGGGPRGIAISPDGRLLFTANGSGTVSAFTIATDGSLPAADGSPQAAGVEPTGVAVSPDGSSLYVSAFGSNAVVAFSIGAGGALSPLGSYVTGSGPSAIAVMPDGSHLYVVNELSDDVSAFAVEAGGTLGTSVAYPAGGADPAAASVTPDGRRLVVGLRGADRIAVLSIGAGGALASVAGSPFSTVAEPAAIAVAPGGEHLYATATATAELGGHALSAAGALTTIAGSPFSDGGGSHGFQSIAITPDQPPRASFAYTQSDLVTDFDAGDSADPDGTIASYAWDFGDGESSTEPDPVASHAYQRPGTYTATLTTTDDQGCGPSPSYGGQTAFCNGGAGAVTTAVVIVPRPQVLNPYLEVKRTQKQGGRKVSIRVRAGAGEPVRVEARGSVAIGGSERKIALAKRRGNVNGGARKMLELTPKSRGGSRKVLRLLDRGEKLRAAVSVRFTDTPGNTATERAAIRLRSKR